MTQIEIEPSQGRASGVQDVFQIHGYMRFLLVVRALGSLTVLIATLWLISQPNIKLSKMGPLILVGLGAWFLYEAYQTAKWFNFSVALSDEKLSIKGKDIPWSEIASATAKNAVQFQPFIRLETKKGEKFVIPGAIQQPSFVLTKIEKHFPNLQRQS